MTLSQGDYTQNGTHITVSWSGLDSEWSPTDTIGLTMGRGKPYCPLSKFSFNPTAANGSMEIALPVLPLFVSTYPTVSRAPTHTYTSRQ